jgi:hypothetical protein
MDTAALLKMTRAAGLSDRTVKRARADLKVVASQRHDPTTGRVIGWELRLPDGTFDPLDRQRTTPSAFGPLGPVGTVGVNRENKCELEPEDQRAKSGKPLALWDAPPPEMAQQQHGTTSVGTSRATVPSLQSPRHDCGPSLDADGCPIDDSIFFDEETA